MAVVPILPPAGENGDHAEAGERAELHLLSGVKIDHDGPANVSKYFSPTVEESAHHKSSGDAKGASNAMDAADGTAASTSQDRHVESIERRTGSFRGRLLRGAKVSCEDGYKLYVVEKEPSSDREEDDEGEAEPRGRGNGAYRIIGSTDACTYWKHHVPVDPSTDALYRAMKWVNVAGVLHGD